MELRSLQLESPFAYLMTGYALMEAMFSCDLRLIPIPSVIIRVSLFLVMSINQSIKIILVSQNLKTIPTSSQDPHMVPREQPFLTRINPPKPILINLLRLPNLSILRESQLVLFRHKAVPKSQTPQPHASIGRQNLLRGPVVFQRPAADELADHNALLAAFGGVLEADDGHAVVLQTPPPAVGAVGLGDFAGCDEAVIAFVADVVVAFVARVAVETRVCGRDGVVADVAVLADGQGDVAVLGEVRHGDCVHGGLVNIVGGAVVSHR